METWLFSFLQHEPSGAELSYNSLSDAFNKMVEVNKISFVRQMLGKGALGLTRCTIKGSLFKIFIRNIFDALCISLIRKIVKSDIF